jgi:cytoskeleton protein RodZ
VLRAKADTWVDVRGHEGSALISRVLHAGESWQVPDQPALFLSTGNAGGLDLLVDGKPAPAIGPSGAIRHDLPLDAGRIRDGRYPTEPPARAKHPPPGK